MIFQFNLYDNIYTKIVVTVMDCPNGIKGNMAIRYIKYNVQAVPCNP